MPNVFDVMIVATFMALVGVGFFNGVSRLAAAIVAVYFGAVLAAVFYRAVTDAAMSIIPGMGRTTGELAMFFLLFLGFSTGLTVMMARWLGGLTFPRRIRILDNIGGAMLGILVAGLALTVSAMLLAVSLQVLNRVAGSGSSPLGNFFENGIERSALVPVFLRLAPYFIRTISPWFPGGLPPILRRVA